MERYEIVSYADANFLQMFIWERFKILTPKTDKFSTVEKPIEMKPRELSWMHVWLTTRKTLKGDPLEKNFEILPYSYTPLGVNIAVL